MLEALTGNKSIEKVLLFLLVNRKCYGSQLQKMLKAPLTPIQKALFRLEKGGIVSSFYEGKTRIYQFNDSYALKNELEALLKRAYSNLSSNEKKQYYFAGAIENFKTKEQAILSLWKRLQNVNYVEFKSKSHSKNGQTSRGVGSVFVNYDDRATIVFQEEGKRDQFDFHNTFRWTLSRLDALIGLEHLRHGINNPVFLFHLTPTGKNTFESLHSHICGEDTYFGKVKCEHNFVILTWRIIGPKKNEEIEYIYKR